MLVDIKKSKERQKGVYIERAYHKSKYICFVSTGSILLQELSKKQVPRSNLASWRILQLSCHFLVGYVSGWCKRRVEDAKGWKGLKRSMKFCRSGFKQQRNFSRDLQTTGGKGVLDNRYNQYLIK